MFEQPELSPEQRYRRNRLIGMRVAGSVMVLAIAAATSQWKNALIRVFGPFLALLLVLGPVLVGQWLGRQKKWADDDPNRQI